MKQISRITIVRLSRHLLVFFVSLLLLFFTSCDLNFKFPTFPSFKSPPKKNDLLAALRVKLATIQGATITLKGDDIIFYFDDPIDTEYLASTIQSVFGAFTVVADDWSISIKDTAYSPQKAVVELVERVGQFKHIWEEEVAYSAQVTYKGYPFNLSGEFVFQDIFMKLMSTDGLAAFHAEAYLVVHQSTIDLDEGEVTFEHAVVVLRALAEFDKLSGDAKALLENEKDLLDKLFVAIQKTATEKQLEVLNSFSTAKIDCVVTIPFEPGIDVLSLINIGGLRSEYNLAFFDELGGSQINTLDLPNGASTFIVYMEATLKDGSSFPSISGEVIIKVGSVSIEENGTELFTIEDALEQAGNDDIFVRYNTSFASKDVAEKVYGKTEYRIGSPTTLVLPYDETLSSEIDNFPIERDAKGNIKHITAGHIDRSGGYVRLTVPEGITIDLKGRLVVSAKRAACKTKFQGHVTGKNYSVLNLEEDSKINIEYRGELYALGFVEGEGEIEVESGGYVYEGLFISSFRGGTATSRIEEDVFPFDQFTVMQIESPLIINSGGNYIAKALVWVSSKYRSGDLALVGPSGLFRIGASNGNVHKSFNKESGHVTFTFNGNGSINNGSVQVGSISASTTGRAIPFDGTWHFVVSGGSTLDINAKVALLPGSSLTVESGATVVVKEGTGGDRGRNELTIFNADNIPYPEDYNDYPNATIESYYRNPPSLGYSPNSGAEVRNSGTIEIEKNSGIAGFITNDGGTIDIGESAITEYTYYVVSGSADQATTYTVPVEYHE